MNKLVTEERLTEIEKMFWYKRADGSDAAAKELAKAYRTLRTENERLAAHLHGEHYCQHDLSEPAP